LFKHSLLTHHDSVLPSLHLSPSFSIRLIISSLRNFDSTRIEKDVEEAVYLMQRNLDLVSGFDLVAEEDPNYRTLDYLDIWMELKAYEEKHDVEIPLFFHDGESNDRNDTNIVDAVQLGSRRIGHGTNLYFFPFLFDQIRDEGITLEVNPISNQVLRYVDNLELHPVNTFLAEGLNVVIAADDPGCFGYSGLTYDFWISLVSFQLDLKGIKTLSYNGLNFSSVYDEGIKKKLIENWEKEWDSFIDRALVKVQKAGAGV
jgi:adenosine deaminase CECR1